MAPATANFAAWVLEVGAPDAVAVRDAGRDVTYAELRARVAAAAARVAAAVPRGAIVPLAGEGSVEMLAAYLGVMYAGAVAAPLAPMAAASLRGVIAETGATFAFAARAQAAQLAGLVPDVATVEEVAPGDAIAPVAVDDAAMSLLLYTSGSTGAARGVMLSARNLRANAGAILGFLPLTPGDRALVTLPLYYCYGASVIHTHLRAGASVALSRAAFPEELCDELERSGATGLPAVPSLIKLLVDRSSIATRALPRLRYAMVSGGHLLDADVRKLRAALPDLALYIRYGVTELTAAASYLPPERLGDRLGSIGRGLPGAPLRVERDDGREVTPGADEVGEIVGAGPHVALGYYRTTDAAFRDGKFYTGDLARIDADGFIVVIGRAKEFVKTGGHRVSPVEIEGVLAELPGVLEVAVCGVPHPVRGEALVAGVVARPGHAPSAAELRAHCAARLPTFKVPVAFVLLPELPKTANGKISRRQLADALARGATNGDGPLFVPPSTA